MGEYGARASGWNWEVGGGRIASGLALTNKRAIARAFGTTTKPSETVMLLTVRWYQISKNKRDG